MRSPARVFLCHQVFQWRVSSLAAKTFVGSWYNWGLMPGIERGSYLRWAGILIQPSGDRFQWSGLLNEIELWSSKVGNRRAIMAWWQSGLEVAPFAATFPLQDSLAHAAPTGRMLVDKICFIKLSPSLFYTSSRIMCSLSPGGSFYFFLWCLNPVSYHKNKDGGYPEVAWMLHFFCSLQPSWNMNSKCCLLLCYSSSLF